MAFVIKALGANTIIVTGTADLYTVPAAKSALVTSVRLVNGTTAVTTALNLYVKPSGATARRINKKDFTIAASMSLVVEDAVTLGQGDKIQLDIAGGATPSLGYLVNGLERD
jgi:hypothetical protein